MRVKVDLPEGFRYAKAHSSKWALFYHPVGVTSVWLGYVRKINRELHGFEWAYYAQVRNRQNMIGPFDSKDEAAKALIVETEFLR